METRRQTDRASAGGHSHSAEEHYETLQEQQGP